MSEDIDPSSFASILEGVRRMRQQYEPDVPPAAEAPAQVAEAAPKETIAPPSTKSVLPPRRVELPPQRIRHVRGKDQAAPATRVLPNTTTTVKVANSQKGNPLLTNSLMKNYPWTFDGQILCDYYINAMLQILFLLLKYHRLHPEYIWTRLKKLNKGLTIVGETQSDRVLRILLVVVDIDSHEEILRKLTDICLKHDLTLVLAWSFEEAGNYVAFCKKYEMSASRIDSAIKGVKKTDYQSCVVDTLTSIKYINKTDVVNLLANCKSVQNIVRQSSNDGLAGVQGLGARKLANMKSVFTEPFILNRDYD